MRDSARDCQAHVETRTFRRTLISLPSLSPFLHSPIETLFRPCPRIHTLPALLTLRLIFQPPVPHSARFFAVAVALKAAVWQRQAAVWQLKQRQVAAEQQQQQRPLLH